ncbi:redoxin family protein [Caldalkalibacillus mannanilyticus]|uniref:redoxin family protein n=1 Tax=Caldalkalibacillus mannanilyticus TaxID=1418 RepID=UPI00046A3A6F|nr:redoxin family protein [Caldalkalibacillus mannanilyticus]
MNNTIRTIILVAVFIGIAVFAYLNFFSSDESGKVKDITTLEHIDGGESIDLTNYLGKKKLILHFVAVPCDCCSYTIPYNKELVAEQDEIEVVTVVFNGKKSTIRKKFEEYNLNYPWGLDLDKSISSHYGVSTSPTYVFFDEEGNHLGNYPYVISDKENLIQAYQSALDEFQQGK